MFKKKMFLIGITIIISIIISVHYFGRLVDMKMADYVTEEVNKISKILIRKILNNDFIDGLDVDNLFVVVRNDNDDNLIEMIDLNTAKVNNILGKVNDEILYYFSEFDHGNVELFSKYSTVFNNYTIGGNRGIYINVPLGIVFSNPVLFGIGPNIPIKILLSGQVESNIITSIKQYGINNALLELKLEIRAREEIIFPFSNRYVDVKLEIPLIIELISGKVPENYLNTQNSGIIE